jgi:hypothetical protein
VDAIEVVARLLEEIWPNANPRKNPSDSEK